MLVRLERKIGRDDADDRCYDVAGHGAVRLECADHFDRCGIEQDLLLRLAQRRGDRVFARIDPSAGESDLAGMGAHILAPHGQDHARLAAGR